MAYSKRKQGKNATYEASSYRTTLQRTVVVGCNLLVDLNNIVVRRQEGGRSFLQLYPPPLSQAIVVLHFTPMRRLRISIRRSFSARVRLP